MKERQKLCNQSNRPIFVTKRLVESVSSDTYKAHFSRAFYCFGLSIVINRSWPGEKVRICPF